MQNPNSGRKLDSMGYRLRVQTNDNNARDDEEQADNDRKIQALTKDKPGHQGNEGNPDT